MGKIWVSSTKSWKMAFFCCNATGNFTFWFKYCQGKVDLNTSKKFLVFVTIRQKISYLRLAIVYENLMLTQNYAFAQRCCFLHFRLKEISENMIFPWNGNIRKLTQIWSFLPFSQIFVRRKLFFSCGVPSLPILCGSHKFTITNCAIYDIWKY